MNRYCQLLIILIAFFCMAINIQWDKESIKSFITGGALVWMAMKFYRK
mgnify:CR=1 FL=1